MNTLKTKRMLKDMLNAKLDYGLLMGGLMADYNRLHELGKLNLVELVMYVEKLDEYSACERCLSIMERGISVDKSLEKEYLYLRHLQASYREPLPRKLDQFYHRLCNQLDRLSQEVFTLRELRKWEHRYRTPSSTVSRWLKRLQDLGYVELLKKDKLTGYQYRLRFKRD